MNWFSESADLIDTLNRYLEDPDIRKVIIDNLGNNSLAVIRYIIENNLSEFKEDDIAKTLNISNKEVREVLNRMYDEKIMIYRKESTNNYNWYNFYWNLNIEDLVEWIRTRTFNKTEEIKIRVENEELYYCPHCSTRFNIKVYDFDQAIEHGFRCEVCGGQLQSLDRESIIKYE